MNKTKKPKEHYSRVFLNKKKGSAHTIVQGSFDGSWSFDGSALFADCNRNATIEFFSYNLKDYDANYIKLTKMINELIALQDYMKDNREYAEQMFSKKKNPTTSLARMLHDSEEDDDDQ